MRNNLKTLRQQRNWTQTQVAEKVGVSRQTIYSIEQGIYVPSTVLGLKLAAVFEMKLGDIFKLESEDWN
nr:helix-turn-helix transcriptional regulator [Saprospiraceae bacterium]